MVSVSSKYCSG